MTTIQHEITLDYYDGPVVFEGRDRIGGNYVAVLGGGNEVNPVYAVVGVSPESLYAFRNGEVDLRALMLEAGSKEWFLTTPGDVVGEFDLELQRTQLEKSDYLPNHGYLLDPATSSDIVVLDAAQRRENLVIELKAEPPESRSGNRIHLDSLVQLLVLMQKLVGHAYRSVQKERGKRILTGSRWDEAVRMDVVVPAIPGSFCMLLEARSKYHDTEECALASSLQYIDALFESSNSKKTTSAANHFLQSSGHLASTYFKLLNFLAKEKVGFHYTWADPSSSKARQSSMTAKRALRLSNSLLESKKPESTHVTLTGRLVQADLKSGTWRLESGNNPHRGKVTADRSTLNGLKVGKMYRFDCIEDIVVSAKTGREVRTLKLVKAKPA